MEALENNKTLISYFMLTYNQEKFVREAVESALAQTYSPLEIIISDDCSTDSTFEIIKKTVAKYKGPHKVIVRQNEQNLGLSIHFNKVLGMLKGELFVGGAGDDIAFPEKTEKFAEVWLKNKNITALSSGYKVIDSDGKEIKTRYLEPEGLSSDDLFSEMRNSIWCGCSVTFSARLFKFFGNIKYKDSTEDRVMFRRAIMLGNVYRIKEPLIYYRQGGISGQTTDIRKIYRFWSLHFHGLKNFLHDVRKVPQTTETQTCRKYIYKRCWVVLSKMLILKMLMKLNVNPFPVMAMIKNLLRSILKILSSSNEHYLKLLILCLFGPLV